MDSAQTDQASENTPEVGRKIAQDFVTVIEKSIASGFPQLEPNSMIRQLELHKALVAAPIKIESVVPNHSGRAKTFLPINSIFKRVIDQLLSNYESQKQTLHHLLETSTDPKILDLTNIKLKELELLKKFQAIPDGSRDLWEVYLNLIDNLEIVLKEKYNENIPHYVALAIQELKDLREAFSSSDIGVNYITYLKVEDGTTKDKIIYSSDKSFSSGYGKPNPVNSSYEKPILDGHSIIGGIYNYYIGNIVNGKKDGYGIFFYGSQELFLEGLWEDDSFRYGKRKSLKPNGTLIRTIARMPFREDGKLVWKTIADGPSTFFCNNGDRIEELWEEGTLKHTKVTYANGDIYEGDFKDGKKQGRGKIIYANDDVLKSFDGTWSNDEFSKGKLVYNSGDVYDGDFNKGGTLPDGEGLMVFHEKDEEYISFNGKWTYGNFTNGELEYANGDIYRGDFEESAMHGEGIMFYEDGDVFDGIWENDEIISGKLTPHDSSIFQSYEGKFINGAPNDSEGKIIYHDRFTYIGGVKSEQLEDDEGVVILRHGRGVLTENGISYEGIWNNNQINGKTTIRYPDGSKFVGHYDFSNGKRKSGTIRYNYNHYYTGYFGLDELNQPNGLGKETFIEGDKKTVYKGKWCDGKRQGQFEVTIIENDMERKETQHYLDGELQPTMRSGPGSAPENADASSQSNKQQGSIANL